MFCPGVVSTLRFAALQCITLGSTLTLALAITRTLARMYMRARIHRPHLSDLIVQDPLPSQPSPLQLNRYAPDVP